MLYVPLDRSAKRTYTQQIYRAIREKILSGGLCSGELLPSYRELSSALSVSKNTVLSAYEMLVADGLLRSVVGSGFYVEDGLTKRPAALPVYDRQSAALSDLVMPDGTINFDNGQPALELFPRSRWSKAVTAAMAEAPLSALGYDLPQGRPELRRALCDLLGRTKGLACRPEQIVITSGAKQAIALAAECLLTGGGEVWIEDPAPALLAQMLACHTDRIVPIPIDRSGLDPAAFPPGRTPRLIVTSPARQFPMGVIMPMARRIALAEAAGSAYLLEDDFESEFNYDAPPSASLRELAPEQTISVGTFSKTMYPSIRLGYMVAPEHLVPRLCEHKRLSDHHTDPVHQLALASLIRSGAYERHVRRMRRVYRDRRDHLIACLHEQFGAQVRITGAATGMSLVVGFPGTVFTAESVQRLLRQGVYAVPVEQQTARKGWHEDELLLRYAGLTKEELSLGVARIRAALSDSMPR